MNATLSYARAGTIKSARGEHVPASKQEKGDFRWVKKTDLFVDADYQRGQRAFVDHYAKNWWWACAGTISVCERDDGTLAVFDGKQRTLAALKRNDISHLPCMIYRLQSIPEEASAFLGIQTGRKAVSAIEKFNGLLYSNDKMATFLEEVIATSGYKVQKSSANYSLGCVSAALSCAEMGKELFRDAFPLIAEIHGGAAIEQRVMLGVCYLFKISRAEIDNAFARARVVKIGHVELAKSIQTASAVAGYRDRTVFAKGIVDRFNRSLRSNRITIFDLPKDDV